RSAAAGAVRRRHVGTARGRCADRARRSEVAAVVSALEGDDIRVDVTAIEKSLADLWRTESGKDDDHGVTRAALWNVVAHTTTPELHTKASETLGRAAADVPQRTIVIRSDAAAVAEL